MEWFCLEKNDIEFQLYIENDFVDYLKSKSKSISYDLLSSNDDVEKHILQDIIFIINDCVIKKCMSLSSIKTVIETSKAYMTKENLVFDNKPDLLGFNNGVYDLINHEFRPYKYDDYMTMTCGYDYTDKIDKTKLQTINTLIEQIMPDPDIRKLYLQILSAGLTGRAIEKFVVFNGGGRNGKGLINEFIKLVLGDYALIYANVSILTEKDKTGANPEKAMLDNKRFVVMKEPQGDIKLKNDRVKDITGGGNISGRMLFSNKTEIKLS